jgi:hypothetical protein
LCTRTTPGGLSRSTAHTSGRPLLRRTLGMAGVGARAHGRSANIEPAATPSAPPRLEIRGLFSLSTRKEVLEYLLGPAGCPTILSARSIRLRVQLSAETFQQYNNTAQGEVASFVLGKVLNQFQHATHVWIFGPVILKTAAGDAAFPSFSDALPSDALS